MDLTAEHAKQAASSSDGIRSLLKHVSEIARPGEGCPKILMALARLVGQDWIEGELRVELSGDETSTTLIVMSEYGASICERLFPAVRFAVPLDEFQRALELAPRLVLPLKITDEPGKLVLTPLLSPEKRADAQPREFELEAASLGEEERSTAPPPPDELQVVDEAVPDEEERSTAPPPPDELQVVDEAVPDEVQFSNGFGEPDLDWGPLPDSENDEPRDQGSRTSDVHTRPTVRRMVAVDAAAIAAIKRRDPRREED